MSFHKKRLDKENIIRIYDNEGLLGLEKYIGDTNTIITSNVFSYNIVNTLIDEKLNLPQKWNKILKIIKKEKYTNERKRITV